MVVCPAQFTYSTYSWCVRPTLFLSGSPASQLEKSQADPSSHWNKPSTWGQEREVGHLENFQKLDNKDIRNLQDLEDIQNTFFTLNSFKTVIQDLQKT